MEVAVGATVRFWLPHLSTATIFDILSEDNHSSNSKPLSPLESHLRFAFFQAAPPANAPAPAPAPVAAKAVTAPPAPVAAPVAATATAEPCSCGGVPSSLRALESRLAAVASSLTVISTPDSAANTLAAIAPLSATAPASAVVPALERHAAAVEAEAARLRALVATLQARDAKLKRVAMEYKTLCSEMAASAVKTAEKEKTRVGNKWAAAAATKVTAAEIAKAEKHG